MRILIIKTSSLGDVVHVLPAVNDLRVELQNKLNEPLVIDWVIEPGFSEIVKLSSIIDNIIEWPFRLWRKNIIKYLINGEIFKKIKKLRQYKYDYIIDAQGLYKSSILGLIAKGKVFGFDKKSIREPLASIFYHKKFFVEKENHALDRQRLLFSKIFNYELKTKFSYGLKINNQELKKDKINEPYVIFLHGTTWNTKKWPKEYWIALANQISKLKLKILLPWGNESELIFAKDIAKMTNNTIVLEKTSISNMVHLISNANFVVSVDTGLMHLCAALNTTTFSIYGPTSTLKTGAKGDGQNHLSSNLFCSPCFKRSCKISAFKDKPDCMLGLKPSLVFDRILNELKVKICDLGVIN